MTKQIEQAKCEIQVKLLVNEVQPLRRENRTLRTEVKKLQTSLFKQEMYTYSVGIIGIIIAILIARKAFQFRYKKEFEFEVAGQRYEEVNQARMGPSSERPKFSDDEKVVITKPKNGPSWDSLSNARKERRKRMVRPEK